MPTPTYTPLANITLGADQASVVFSSISQSYKDLVLVVNGRTSRSAYNIDGIMIRFNSDSSNYTMVRMAGNSSGPTSDTDTRINVGFSGASASDGVALFNIMDYSATDKHKTALVRSNTDASYVSGMVSAGAGRWASTAAITSVTVLAETGPNLVAGMTLALYGIAS